MTPPPSTEGYLDLSALRGRYLEAQLSGDRREALRLVIEEGLHRGAPVTDIQAQVVQQAQLEIGRLWQHNEISIAQEHMATAISQVVLSRLFEHAPTATRIGKKILVACVEGELHDFPARLVADFLELAGFEVRYLGASVPTDHLLAMLRQERPDLLALSVTMSFNAPAAREAVQRVRAEVGGDLPILLGGHALSWAEGLVVECGVQTCDSPEPARLVETAKRALRMVNA